LDGRFSASGTPSPKCVGRYVGDPAKNAKFVGRAVVGDELGRLVGPPQ
jgi:hypothetical protein